MVDTGGSCRITSVLVFKAGSYCYCLLQSPLGLGLGLGFKVRVRVRVTDLLFSPLSAASVLVSA